MMPAVLTVGALALAGCGGGSSTPGGLSCTAPLVPNDDRTDCVDPKEEMAENQPETSQATALSLANDLATAIDELAASAAEDGADSTLKAAMDADGKLREGGDPSYDPSLQGRSASVLAYANMVIAARADLESDLEDARDALKAARDRLATASDEEKTALRRQIDRADDAIEDAEDMLEKESDLDVLVMAYTNEDDDDGNAPADRASAYAAALLDEGSVRGTRTALAGPTALAGDSPIATALGGDDVFGAGSHGDAMELKDIAAFSGTLVDNTPVAPLNGVDVDDLALTALTAAAIIATDPGGRIGNTDGSEVSYQGIEGYLRCIRADCEAPEGDKLGAGWHFVPASTENAKRWTENEDGDGYIQATYVEWGLWMAAPTSPTAGATDLNVYVGPGRGSTALAVAGLGDLDEGRLEDDNKATYSGTAAGLSVRTTGTGDDAVSASGHFTADVTLDATFGATPTLGGKVDNFRPVSGQGSAHVNSGWAFDLSTDPDAGDGVWSGTISGRSTTGTWRAQAYGGSDASDEKARPTGVYGGIEANFPDGAAAGVFHTTKD